MTMRSYRSPMGQSLQQRADHADNRQQQQDNGTHEFQPPRQQGDHHGGSDYEHSLEAYLQRARQSGEMPVPRQPGAAQLRRADLRLAK